MISRLAEPENFGLIRIQPISEKMIFGFYPDQRFRFGKGVVECLEIRLWPEFIVGTLHEIFWNAYLMYVLAIRVFGGKSDRYDTIRLGSSTAMLSATREPNEKPANQCGEGRVAATQFQ